MNKRINLTDWLFLSSTTDPYLKECITTTITAEVLTSCSIMVIPTSDHLKMEWRTAMEHTIGLPTMRSIQESGMEDCLMVQAFILEEIAKISMKACFQMDWNMALVSRSLPMGISILVIYQIFRGVYKWSCLRLWRVLLERWKYLQGWLQTWSKTWLWDLEGSEINL